MPTLRLPTTSKSRHRAGDTIQAFIFDVDGVIADTARLHEQAWRRLADREGWPLDAATAHSLRGLSREASLNRILGERDVRPALFNELMEQKNADYLALVDQLTPRDLLPGVSELLSELNTLGIHVAAASASRNAKQVLAKLGVWERFAAVIDGADEAESPHRLHRFLMVAAALRAEPRTCAVVEDSTAGVSAARQFGMRCVGIGRRDALCAATMVFESLRGVDARSLIRWLARSASDAASMPIEYPA